MRFGNAICRDSQQTTNQGTKVSSPCNGKPRDKMLRVILYPEIQSLQVLIYVSKRPYAGTDAQKGQRAVRMGRSKDVASWPSIAHAMDASFDGYSDPTAIMSHFPNSLIDPTYANVTTFIQTLVLGPAMGWSKWPGRKCGFGLDRAICRIGAFTIVPFVASVINFSTGDKFQ